jgi:hypothetical protein
VVLLLLLLLPAALEAELSALQEQLTTLSAAAEVEAKESERTVRLQDDLDRLDAGVLNNLSVDASGWVLLLICLFLCAHVRPTCWLECIGQLPLKRLRPRRVSAQCAYKTTSTGSTQVC